MKEAVEKIKFTTMIIESTNVDTGEKYFTGIIKEFDGVVVQRDSFEEVKNQMPIALKAMIAARSKMQNLDFGIGSKIYEEVLVFG